MTDKFKKSFVITLTLFLIFPLITLGAISYDNASNGTEVNGNSITYAHTVGTGANLLVVMIGYNLQTSNTVTGVTFNGDAMTYIDSGPMGFDSGWGDMYYMVNPDEGEHNIVVSLSTSQWSRATSASYSGVNTADPIDVSNKTQLTSNSYTFDIPITTTTSGAWVISGASSQGNTDPGMPYGQTNVTKRAGNAGIAIGDSNGIVSVGSFTQTWKVDAPYQSKWGGIIISVKPTAASTPVTSDVIWFE